MMRAMAPVLTQDLQQSTSGHAAAWDIVWLRQESTWSLIGRGRNTYNRLFFSLLLPHLSPRKRLLELGSGTSTLGMRLSPFVELYVGIDASKRAIESAQAEAKKMGLQNMSFREQDIYDQPTHDRFDIVWSQGLVEHFQNVPSVIERHLDFSAPGGTVIISVPSASSYLELWYRITRLRFLRRLWPWTTQRFFRPQDLEAAMGKIDHTRYRSFTVSYLRPRIAGIVVLVIHT